VENLNARNLQPHQVPGPFDIIVIDVSFISLKLIFPHVPPRLKPGGILLALIKPQFEAGRGKAPGGVVKDPSVWDEVLNSFKSDSIFFPSQPLKFKGFMESPLEGKEGNKEYFGCWEK